MRRILWLTAIVAASCVSVPQPPTAQTDTPPAVTIVAENGAWIGVTVKIIDGRIVVDDIYWNSPAAAADLRKGDVLQSVNGKPVARPADIANALRESPANTPLRLAVVRFQQTITLQGKEKPTDLSIDDLSARYKSFLEKGKVGESFDLTAETKLATMEKEVLPATTPLHAFIAAPTPSAERKPPSVRAWLGVGFDDVNDLAAAGGKAGEKGIRVSRVNEKSPAEKAGLRVGDVIAAINGTPFPAEKEKSPRVHFVDFLKEKKPGDSLTLSILRESTAITAHIDARAAEIPADKVPAVIREMPEGRVVRATVTKNAEPKTMAVTLGAGPETASPDPASLKIESIRPELAKYRSDLELLSRRLMTLTGTTAQFDDLMKRYRDDELWDDGFRLKEFRYLHCVPFNIPRVCDDIAMRIRSASSGDFPDFDRLLAETAAEIDEDDEAWKRPAAPLKTDLTPEEHLRQIEEVLTAAARLRDEAFRGLPSDDVRFLHENILGLTERFVTDTHLSDLDEFKDRHEKDKRILELLRHIDYGKLLLSAREAARMLLPPYLEGLRKDLLHAAAKPEAEILWSRETPYGKIVVGGAGSNRHYQPCAVIIDLGGDDFYTNRMGVSQSLAHPTSIVIDYAGNDRYSSFEHGCQGTGILGCGILADLEGDDVYIAQNWGQGSGLVGVGILHDNNGHDSYRGQEYVQGAGFFGVGIQIDGVGDDVYQSNLYAQGFAGTKSLGLLLDNAGDDVYTAAGKHRTGYGDNPGTFNGLAQGCGLGIRCYADWTMSRSGGIGLLLDGAGADRYEAGTFSQGGGYFFAMGMLCDYGNDNDDYLGTRYAQGFAAHSAVGYFLDEGGDDHHRALAGVHSGLSWDLTCVAYIDKAGNDVYESGGFSRGASAHNGFCLFLDMGGNDMYLDDVGRSGDNTYHGGASFSLFIDGGGDDKYADGHENNTVTAAKEYGFIIDTEKTPVDIERDEALPSLIINKIK